MDKTVTPIEVRYQETDQMGVVYHANYLIWFEVGRTKYMDKLGIDYIDMEKQNIVSPVTNANITYKKAIQYGERAYVETWLQQYDGIRVVYGYHIINEINEVAVSGSTEHVIVDRDTFRPLSFRKTFPKWHEIYNNQLKDER